MPPTPSTANWQPDDSPWGQFVHWAARFATWPGFDARERDDKLEIAARMAAAREAVLSESENWPQLLRRAFGPPNNLTQWHDDARFNQWCADNPERARQALVALWDADRPVGERIQAFAAAMGRGVLGMQLPTISLLLMADPGEPFAKGIQLTGEPPLLVGRNVDLGSCTSRRCTSWTGSSTRAPAAGWRCGTASTPRLSCGASRAGSRPTSPSPAGQRPTAAPTSASAVRW